MSTRHVVCGALLALGLSIACSTPVATPAGATPHRAEPAVAGVSHAVADPHSAEAIGSTRNARVALELSGVTGPLTYFAGELTDSERAELAALAPNVRIVTGLSREAALARAGEAHGIDARFATAEFLERAPKLVWVQAMSAGVDRYVGLVPLVENERIVLTNMRGVHGPAIADHAFGMLLALTRDLAFYRASQVEGRWAREGSGARSIALDGRTLCVVGLGGIGTEVARRGHGFGMHVIATRRSDTPAPEFVERIGRADELLSFLPEADVVVVCVPLTAETEKLIDARAFAAMKPGAYIVNVARGKIVDTEALVDALASGRLAGACLDVTDPEPLPPDHPLWRMSNVVITPHVASDAELTDRRAWQLLRENVRRFGAGEPLLNVVDKRAGY